MTWECVIRMYWYYNTIAVKKQKAVVDAPSAEIMCYFWSCSLYTVIIFKHLNHTNLQDELNIFKTQKCFSTLLSQCHVIQREGIGKITFFKNINIF